MRSGLYPSLSSRMDRFRSNSSQRTGYRMKIYIAGSSQELGRCERAILFATSLGFHITYDWTSSVRSAIAQGVLEHEMPFEQRAHQARRDLDAVKDADAVVLLAPEKGAPSRGCWVELGYALGLDRRVFCIRSPHTANEGLFESLGTTVYASNDRHGLTQVARTLGMQEVSQ